MKHDATKIRRAGHSVIEIIGTPGLKTWGRIDRWVAEGYEVRIPALNHLRLYAAHTYCDWLPGWTAKAV